MAIRSSWRVLPSDAARARASAEGSKLRLEIRDNEASQTEKKGEWAVRTLRLGGSA